MADRDGNSFVWFLAGLGLGALAGVVRSRSEARHERCCVLVQKKEKSTCELGPAT